VSGEANNAQSTDTYERMTFTDVATGETRSGVIGTREGIDNRVVYIVWDGPSASATGPSLAAAHAQARSRIISKGFVPAQGEEAAGSQANPSTRISVWLCSALSVCALICPTLARAELPVVGQAIPFPNAPYAYRYEGPDFDPRSTSPLSAVRIRQEAKAQGLPVTDRIVPRISIIANKDGKQIAHYAIPQGTFCDYEDDNCKADGIFPIVLSGTPNEPVLAALTHHGATGQKLTIFRPLTNPTQAMFEATASKAVHVKPLPTGLAMELEHARADGKPIREHRLWLTGDETPCTKAPDVKLARPAELKGSARAFDTRLRRIARARDFDGFMALLTDDILVTFGGNGGKPELVEHWRLQTPQGRERFWMKIDELLSVGAGPMLPAAPHSTPETITYPWYFSAWPPRLDADDIFMVASGTVLRAGPDVSAPHIATLPFTPVRMAPPEGDTQAVDWLSTAWLPVAAPGHCLGYVRKQDAKPLLDTRNVVRRDREEWKIEAIVAGD
jgi:hypothetical protein